MRLIHWGNFFRNPLSGAVYFWKNEKVIFPVMRHIFCYERLGIIDIFDSIKIDINASEEEGIAFFENEVSALKWSSEKNRKLNNLEDFSSKSNTVENL